MEPSRRLLRAVVDNTSTINMAVLSSVLHPFRYHRFATFHFIQPDPERKPVTATKVSAAVRPRAQQTPPKPPWPAARA